jgi:hypothetical protein
LTDLLKLYTIGNSWRINMKRNLLSLIILVNVFFNIYTQDMVQGDLELKINYGNFGGGMNIFSNEYNFEFSTSLLNLFIEHDKTNIGLELTPLKYMANYSIDAREWNQGLYFLNGNLYWNSFDIKNIILGPFISINYLKLENWSGLNTNGYIFSSGLRFLLRTYIEDWKYPFHIIGSEIGYRNISGRQSFYFNVNLDIREPLKTSVFGGFLTPWRKLQLRNLLYIKELAIFSVEPLETQPGFSEVPISILVGLIVGILQGEASEDIEANEDSEKQIPGTGPFVPKEPKQPKLPFQDDRDIK